MILRLLEPKLRSGASIVAENAFEGADGYLAYIRDPTNGYRPIGLPDRDGRGNGMAVRV